jgi:riboflavin transporter FmnP
MRGKREKGWDARTVAQTGLFIALGILLPILFHQFGIAGRIFLPMHIPVFLAGALIGPASGFVVGAVCPALSFLLTGMPPALRLPLMTLELPLYGLVFGFLTRRSGNSVALLVGALIVAQVVGRLGYGLGLLLFGRFLGFSFALKSYLAVAFVTGIFGILIQLVLIPTLVFMMRRHGHHAVAAVR